MKDLEYKFVMSRCIRMRNPLRGKRAQLKAVALMEMVETLSRKHEELRKFCIGRDDYKNRAEEALDRIFENTLREIETLNVSLRNKRLFTE